MKRVDFYYDFVCPFAYLAHLEIEAICARAGAELVHRPFLLGGVFRALGVPDAPSMPEAKARLSALDMDRWAKRRGMPLVKPAGHPIRTLLALRAALASGDLPKATRALYGAYWAQGRDVSDPDVVRSALDAAGLDGAAIVARASSDEVKETLREATDEAVAAGVFGAPTFVVTGDGAPPELYWGQDRLSFVAEALGARAAEPKAPAPANPKREVSFFFDVSSPWAYLASTQIDEVATRAGARVLWRPFLLGGLFRAIGTPDVPILAMPEVKQRYGLVDMNRWSARYGVPFRFPSRFPMRTVQLLRMILALPEDDRPRFARAAFTAYWADDRDLADPRVLAAIAGEVGLDGEALLRASEGDAVKAALKTATDEAVRLGVCGAPSFLVGEALYWGQDRLELVEDALRALA